MGERPARGVFCPTVSETGCTVRFQHSGVDGFWVEADVRAALESIDAAPLPHTTTDMLAHDMLDAAHAGRETRYSLGPEEAAVWQLHGVHPEAQEGRFTGKLSMSHKLTDNRTMYTLRIDHSGCPAFWLEAGLIVCA